MSVSNIRTPYRLGWARNRNAFRMHCATLTNAGTNSTFYVNLVSNIPDLGHHVVLVIDGAEYVYTVVRSSTGTYEISNNQTFFNKIRSCPYVTSLFNMPASDNDAQRLCLIGKATGYHKVEFYCTDALGVRTGYEELMFNWVLGQGGSGSDTEHLPHYAIGAELEVWVNNNNVLAKHVVNGLVYEPDGDGEVTIPLGLLSGFISQADLPSTDAGDRTWAVMTNMLMKYRLGYGEMWGKDGGVLQNWNSLPAGEGTYYYALCGEVAQRYARLDRPDWDDGTTKMSDSNGLFRLIGEESGRTVRVGRSQAEYLYGMWFDTTVSLASVDTVQLRLSLDGGAATTHTVTVRNGEMYRIPVGPAALEAFTEATEATFSVAKYYTVMLSKGGRTWERTYIVQPDYYGATALLLQSKYGVLLSVTVPEVKRELTTEADEMVVDGRRYLDVTERSEKYTARTAQLSRYEARRLAQCLTGEYHYVRCGNSWLRITLEADSFVVRDDAEDMVVVVFSYRFVENQTENIADGYLERSASATEVDLHGDAVAYSDRTPANHNVLLD